jgi:hypothetical protein
MVLYVLTFTFLNSRQEDKRIWTEWQQAFPDFSLLLILRACSFDLLVLFPDIWTLPHQQTICSLSLCYTFALSSDDVTLTYT